MEVTEKIRKAMDLLEEVLSSMGSKTHKNVPEASDEFRLLEGLLLSNEWPSAVDKSRIVEDSEEDKEKRAANIVDLMLPPLCGKKFLDLGCGDGRVVRVASRDALFSCGLDIAKSGPLNWEYRGEKFLLTTDFNKAMENGPYDFVLIYDVLDHVEDPKEVLLTAKKLLSEEGSIFLRCHPWCSRHGSHMYKDLNKAFVHLVFDEVELNNMGLKSDDLQRVSRPLEHYKETIDSAGLTMSEPEVNYEEVESFFKENPLVKSRLLKHFGLKDWTSEGPATHMSVCFVDYVLKKN